MRSARDKIAWRGSLLSVQPRIRLGRSFDQRDHEYLGYVLTLRGTLAEESSVFLVAIGKAAQDKHQLRAGDEIAGESLPVEDPRRETAQLYKTSKLRVVERTPPAQHDPPPWLGVAPPLEVYRERGHRRLAARTYDTHCSTCIWGCRMPVEMIIDHWNPSQRRYRFETFCYGPLSCRLYKAGPTRKVPGRRGMSWEEADWIDEQHTAHRELHD
jgi:hypothetical protein